MHKKSWQNAAFSR